MRAPGMSLAKASAWIALVALNLAAGRALFNENQPFFDGLVLIVPAVEWAIFRAIRGRGRRRGFWVAFAFGGSLAGASSVWSLTHRGSWIDRFWQDYFDHALTILMNVLPETWLQTIERDSLVLGNATMAILEFLPQATLAILSGALVWGILSALRFREPTEPGIQDVDA